MSVTESRIRNSADVFYQPSASIVILRVREGNTSLRTEFAISELQNEDEPGRASCRSEIAFRHG